MFRAYSATSLDAALRYVALGFHVFPCHTIESGICSCGNPTCSDAGKHPLTDNGFYAATNDPDAVLVASLVCGLLTLRSQFVRDVRARMEALGISQRELAEKSGVRQPTISRLLRHKHSPTLDTVQRIAKALGCVPCLELRGE
jgi:DNA-binding phage protein